MRQYIECTAMKRPISFGLLLLASAAPQSPAQQSSPVIDRPMVFSKDIAPILYRHCVTCHRPDGAAPFSLITYDDARRHATQIAAATARRYMPPWKPAPGDFEGERRLSNTEIASIGRWAANARLEGDPSDLPPPPRFSSSWPQGPPDLVVALPEYELRAGGADVFRNFVVPVPGTVPGTVPDTVPGTVSGTVPGMVPGTVSGMVPGTVPGMVSGMVPGTVPGMVPGMVSGTVPGMVPGT